MDIGFDRGDLLEGFGARKIWFLVAFSAIILGMAILTPSAYTQRYVADGEEPEQALGCQDPELLARWIDNEVLPIPTEPPPPLSWYRARGQQAWASFRAPFPQLPVWNPSGVKRVGLQAGHWQYNEAPEELVELRSNPGSYGGGKIDDILVNDLNDAYADATGIQRRDEQVSVRMRWYYGFNARRYQHAVAPGVPQAIIETGFLTSGFDRKILIDDPERSALGIATGILRFLQVQGLNANNADGERR